MATPGNWRANAREGCEICSFCHKNFLETFRFDHRDCIVFLGKNAKKGGARVRVR